MSKSDEEKQCQDLCYVCQESMNYTDSYTLFELPGCGHTFHVDCHSRIFPTDACPICEKPISLCERPGLSTRATGLSTRATGKQHLSPNSDIQCDTSNAHANCDSDIEVLDEAPEHLKKRTKLCHDPFNFDRDITMTQIRGDDPRDYTHAREHCMKHPFGTLLFCDKCYCTLCDKYVRECINWSQHYLDTQERRDVLRNIKELQSDTGAWGEVKLHEKYWRDKEVVIEAVKLNGSNLRFAADSLKSDIEVVLAGLTTHHDNTVIIQHMDKSLRSDGDINWKIVDNNIKFMSFEAIKEHGLLHNVHTIWKKSRHFTKKVAEAFLPQYMSISASRIRNIMFRGEDASHFEHLQSNKKFILDMVKKDGMMLEYACEDLKLDWNVVDAAVEQNIRALDFSSLRSNKTFVMNIIKKNGFAITRADKSLKADKDVALEAVKIDGWNIFYFDEDLVVDQDVVTLAAHAPNPITRADMKKYLVDQAKKRISERIDALNVWIVNGKLKK